MSVLRPLFSLLLLLAAASPLAAEMPRYLTEALARYHSDAPRGWAYSLKTTRGNNTSVERFDPSRPKGGEWSLIESNGRAPTADEIQRYMRYKTSNAPATARATFEKGDLDRGSFTLVQEDDTRAEFQARFREDVGEPLLPHVILILTVNKADAIVERTVLRLVRPFSPALGVRMRELEVTMDFSPPSADRPALPRAAHSRFRGRMFFFVPINEDVEVAYLDYAPVRPSR